MFTYAEILDTPLGVTAWFARTIFRDGTIDILHDRQGWIEGADGLTPSALHKLITGALPEVRKKIKKSHYDPTGHFTLPLYWNPDTRLVVWGCCNGSCGYMYIGAWIEPATDEDRTDLELQAAELAANRRQPDAPYRD